MSWQRIELNMIPDTKVLPVVHASQFDSNRSISFQMFTGEDEWTIPEGLTIELHCRKVDDNIVTLAPLSVDGSVITFITTEQLTACSGQNKCELSFIDADDLVIGSLNFILDVEPDPLKGGLTSASSIYDLTQQIEDITQEVIGDDYYNKTEVDTLLADKADVSDLPDMSLYYTKTATDTLLNAKADKSDTYTKAQVDSALSAKANTADLATVAITGDYDDLINKPVLPDMTQYYTKSEVDNLLDNQFPTFTASGDIATFTTALNKPLVSVTADPLATTITRCGKNFYNAVFPTTTKGGITLTNNGDGTYTLNGSNPNDTYFDIFIDSSISSMPQKTYKLTGCPAGGSGNTYFMYTVPGFHTDAGSGSTFTDSVTGGSISIKGGFVCNNLIFKPMLMISNSGDNTFEAYNGTTVPVADATTITTLSGVNNVFSDTGSVTVQYKYMSM